MTRDPTEPAYDGGRAAGELFLIDARPVLFSFAHHGRSFRLVRSPDRIEVVQGRRTKATESALADLRGDPAGFDFDGQVALVEDGHMLPFDEHSVGHLRPPGLALDRSTLASWVGHAARELHPVHARLVVLEATLGVDHFRPWLVEGLGYGDG